MTGAEKLHAESACGEGATWPDPWRGLALAGRPCKSFIDIKIADMIQGIGVQASNLIQDSPE